MTHYLGLTGSMGMGKSTTAQMFRDAGVPVWDADASVHRLYAKGGAAVPLFRDIFPDAIIDDAIARDKLKDMIAADPSILDKIEHIVHPLVAADRLEFIAANDAAILVFDIPLLFETGADSWLNSVLVVTAPPDVQRARILARPGMTLAHLDSILARQMPDAEKCARADHVIKTLTLDGTRAAVQELIGKLTG